ncbi:hypothetical protein [Streptomyces sp. NBC_01367]
MANSAVARLGSTGHELLVGFPVLGLSEHGQQCIEVIKILVREGH